MVGLTVIAGLRRYKSKQTKGRVAAPTTMLPDRRPRRWTPLRPGTHARTGRERREKVKDARTGREK